MGAVDIPTFLNEASWTGRVFNGDWIDASGGHHDVIEPATGQRLAQVGYALAADIADATKAAASAQAGWANFPPRERAEIFRRAAGFMQAHFDELSRYVARETGGILPKGQHEITEAIIFLHMAASLVMQPTGKLLPSTPGRHSYARQVPHGVVGMIAPFNFPLILAIRAVAPALAVGNAVVLKPDPQTAISGGFLIARVFEAAGLPKGVLHVLPGGAEAGEALCTDRHVQMISFTGSTAVGRRIGELAGRHLKKVSLELGGSNALIVLEDADLELAINNAAWGAFLHQGQICMASNRLLVHASLAEAFTAGLVAKAGHLPVGNPDTEQVALGPVINERQLQRIHAIVQDSVAAGAKLETGGSYERLFYRPTVLSGVRPGMRVFDEEVFGPVANIIVFHSDDEAVELANTTQGSLAAAIHSRSLSRAQAVADRLRSGMVHINDQTVNDDCINPFGGPGAAGNGCSVGGPADHDEYTQWQWVTVKDTPPTYPF